MPSDWRSLFRRAKRLVEPSGNLTQQSVAGGLWVTALNVSDRVLQLLMVIVVANLIGPKEFGLMGIALLSIAAFDQMSKLGLDEALVYNPDSNIDRYLNTTLSLNAARGLAIAAAVFLAAPLIASVFSEPRATPVLRVLALAPFLRGFRNPGVIYFQKNLDFSREFLYTVSGAVAQLLVAIGYALLFPTVWALVLGTLSKRLVQTGVSYLVHPYRPWPEFSLERAKELVDYGKWITGSSIMGFLTGKGDDAVAGWLLGATSLGFYQMAYQISNAPNTEVSHVISRVAFPAYSKLQDDTVRLREALFRTMTMTLLVALPAGVGIAVVAPVFVNVFLGDSWLPMVTTMQLLTVYGMGVAVGSMFGQVWKAVGRPGLIAKFSALKLLLIILLIVPLTNRYGILGTAMTVVIASTLITRPISIVVTARMLDASLLRMARELAYPIVASVGMGIVVWFVREHLVLPSLLLKFVALVGVGAVTYVVFVALLELQFGWGLRSEFRSIRLELAGEDAPA